MKIGIIGGSGLSESEINKEPISIQTPYGETSCQFEIEKIADRTIFFLKRHGVNHSIPPHKVNYRANIFGFKKLDVERIFGIFAVGSLRQDIAPGSIVLPDQIIDFTQGTRECSFYNGPKTVHIDFTQPFCPEMRQAIVEAAKKININIISEATYICVNGPRLETAAEIRFYRSAGADIIGMTLMPEAALAREVEICYSALCVVANFAAGITKNPLTVKEVVETMNKALSNVKLLLKESIKILPDERKCHCKDALKNASF